MKIIVKCEACDDELDIIDCFTPVGLEEIVIKVYPCVKCSASTPEAVDCSKCEEMKRVDELENKLKAVVEIIKNTPPTAVDENIIVNKTKLEPTPDIESTGGYKIPGIKQDSAEGTKAEYGKVH